MIEQIQVMVAEFESNRLEVMLIPSKRWVNEGGMIRVAASKNCTWYRKFCAKYLSTRVRGSRNLDTKIKRANISRILDRIARGLPSRSMYAPELIRIAGGKLS